MDLGLGDKVVIITGGSKGIGLSCARAFLAEGSRVAIVSRAEANLKAAGHELGASASALITVSCDLTRSDAAILLVEEVEQRLGPVNVLVNSAGAAKHYLPKDLNAESWHAGMDAKYFTYIHSMQAVLPGMESRGKGSIVNIIGIGGKVANPVHLPGGAANSALMLATVGLAHAYGPKRVRINGINPGLTMNERMQEAVRFEAKMRNLSADHMLAQRQALIPMRRYATPEDVADLTLFLASEKAKYVTGAIIPMDGGSNPLL